MSASVNLRNVYELRKKQNNNNNNKDLNKACVLQKVDKLGPALQREREVSYVIIKTHFSKVIEAFFKIVSDIYQIFFRGNLWSYNCDNSPSGCDHTTYTQGHGSDSWLGSLSSWLLPFLPEICFLSSYCLCPIKAKKPI